jgi:hypothetical protein
MLNEATIGAAVGIAMGLTKWTVKKATTAVGAVVGLGVGAGIIAGVREHHRVGQERQVHLRQRAEGQEMPAEGAKRREKLEETRYETVPAVGLMDNLHDALANIDAEDPASIQTLIARIGEAQARIEMSDLQSLDLIEYSGKIAVEQERLNLDIALAEARVGLAQMLQNDVARSGIGAESTDTVDSLVASQIDTLLTSLEADIDDKDRTFRKRRMLRSLKMAGIAFVSGEVIGIASQEIRALFDDGLKGMFEGGGGDRRSMLASLLGHGDGNKQNTIQSVHREMFEGGKQMHDVAVDLPPGYHLVQVNPGEKFGWEIQGPDGKNVLEKLDLKGVFNTDDPNPNHIHHLSEGRLGVGFDTQGNLDHDTRMALREAGLDLQQHKLTYGWHHNVPFEKQIGARESTVSFGTTTILQCSLVLMASYTAPTSTNYAPTGVAPMAQV